VPSLGLLSAVSLELIAQADQMEVDAFVGLLDVGVGEVQEAPAELVLGAVTESDPGADCGSELTPGGEFPVVDAGGVR